MQHRGSSPPSRTISPPSYSRRRRFWAPISTVRETVADSVELTVRGHSYDALIAAGGTSDTLIGAAMALLRLNVPGMVIPCVAHGPSLRGNLGRFVGYMLEALGLAPLGATDSFETTGDDAICERWGEQTVALLDHRVRVRSLITCARFSTAQRWPRQQAAAQYFSCTSRR